VANFLRLNRWTDLYLDKKRLVYFLFLVLLLIISSHLFAEFLHWNEQRRGYIFNDLFLNSFQPYNFSFLIGILTHGAIFISLFLLFDQPINVAYFLCAAILMIIFRSITLYLLPLEPPPFIIPLKDPVLEFTFYKGEVLLKDLFFSGHTANIILMAMLCEYKTLKRSMVLIAFMVGILLLIQHVHFTIDVVAAPFFAIIVYKISIFTVNKMFSLENHQIKRCANLGIEFGFRNK
jgi:PAP2 superfamily C-terminal